MHLNSVEIAVITFIVYICIFAIVNRICKCVEHCATARTYSKAVEATKQTKEDN